MAEPKKAIVRVDSSHRIGGGHVMRCLTLADELQRLDVEAVFVCREMRGGQIDRIEQAGFTAHRLPAGEGDFSPGAGDPSHAAWAEVGWERDAAETAEVAAATGAEILIVDHYAFDARWTAAARGGAALALAIDDLDDRPLGAEMLLDQSRLPCQGPRARTAAQAMVGPDYALLRREFAEMRAASLARREGGRSGRPRLLITTGLMDVGGSALLAAEALAASPIDITVAIGSLAESAQDLQALAARAANIDLRLDAANMAELMSEADLAIGAAGATTWERLCLGLPTMAFVLAANQEPIAAALETEGLATVLGRPGGLSAEDLRARIEAKLSHEQQLLEESRRLAKRCDGLGAPRVAEALLKAAP